MQLFFALLPLATLITFIIVFKRSVLFTSIISLLLMIVSTIYWGVGGSVMSAAALRGMFIALEIILILFSALLIFEVMERHKISTLVRQKIEWVSKDYRVQTLFLSAGVIYFMEGVAGFGTPAIIAVPLFIAIGFKPLKAVVLTLLSDTIPVSFGAVGLPITYGIQVPLQSSTDNYLEVLSNTILYVSLISALSLVVLLSLVTIAATEPRSNKLMNLRVMFPLILLASVFVGTTTSLIAIFVGPELASILGGIVGILVITLSARHGILVPRRSSQLHSSTASSSKTYHMHNTLLFKAAVPYAVIVCLLILSRVPVLGFTEVFQSMSWQLNNLFGTTISYEFIPFYSVSVILLMGAIISLVLFHESAHQTFGDIKKVLKALGRVLAILVSILILVQLFTLSGGGTNDVSMPQYIAIELSTLTGSSWPVLSPLVGALGAFVSGSATVSNLIFSGVQYDVSVAVGSEPARVLALQSVGAAVGNMFALHNVVAALTIAKLSEKHTHEVLRRNALPFIFLLALLALTGLLFEVLSRS